MNRNTRFAGTMLLAAIGAMMYSKLSSACTCPQFDHGFLVPAKVELPSNAVGVPWWSENGTVPMKIVFSVERIERDQVTPVDFELKVIRDPFDDRDYPYPWNHILLVMPEDGFVPGAIYRFTCWERYLIPLMVEGEQVDQHSIEATISSERFEADLARPEVDVGRQKHGRLRVSSSGGMCSAEVETAMIGISLYLPPVYERWQGALHYSVLIDGEKLWQPSRSSCHRTPPGMSWVGKGTELVYAWCRGDIYEGYPDLHLDPGRHRIEMKAWLPGTDVVITASTELELGCLVELDLYRFRDETD